MWCYIWLTISGINLWNISQASCPSSIRVNLVNVGYSIKLPVCLSIYLFHDILTKYNELFLFGNFACTFGDITLVVQMHKTVFTPVTLHRRAVSWFLSIFANGCFFMFLNLLRAIQLGHMNFSTDVLRITWRLPWQSMYPKK